MSLLALVAIALASCHGLSNAVLPQFSQSVQSSTMTTAWGKLVDDPTGKPLAHVLVQLEPWKPCRPEPPVPMPTPGGAKGTIWPPPSAWPHPETLACPKPVAKTSTNRFGRFTLVAPKGHYLLVIGSDSSADLTRPTIHDNVILTGGMQRLYAPTPCATFEPAIKYQHCLPQIPLVTPNPAERSGDYRLTTIDAKYERPCIETYDAQRRQRNVEPAVVDEWLTENNRNTQRFVGSKKFSVPFGVWVGWPDLSSAYADTQGGTLRRTDRHQACWAYNTQTAFFRNSGAIPFSVDPRSKWYAGAFGKWNKLSLTGNLLGASQYPRDPRTFIDNNVPVWP